MTVRERIAEKIDLIPKDGYNYRDNVIAQILSIKFNRLCLACGSIGYFYTGIPLQTETNRIKCQDCNGTGIQTKTIKEILEEGKWEALKVQYLDRGLPDIDG